MTLADEDTNSILTDNANRAIQGNVAMQVAPSGGQICNLCKWCHLVANFATYASGAMLSPNLVHVTKSISGSVVPFFLEIS